MFNKLIDTNSGPNCVITDTSTLYDPLQDNSGITLYRFDGNLNDSGPGSYNLYVLTGTPTASYVTGVFNQGMGYTGPENGLTYASDQPDYYAFCFRAKVLAFDDDDDGVFAYNFRRQGYSMPMTRTNFDSNIQLGNDMTLPLNTWVFVCLTINPNDSSLIDLYYDGVFQKSVSAGGSNAFFNSKGVFKSDSAGSPRFNVDQLRTFNRPITQEEVSILYAEQNIVCQGSLNPGQADFFGDGSYIAYYKFDNNLNDEGGSYDLSLTAGSISYVSGVYGQALSLISDLTNVNTNANPYPNSIQTVSMWLKLNAIPDDDSRVFAYNPRRETRTEPALNTSAGEFRIGSSNTLPVGQFVHIVLTVLDTTLTVYYDETPVYTASVASGTYFGTGGLFEDTYSTPHPVYACDNVRLFSRGVTPEEVGLLYTNQ